MEEIVAVAGSDTGLEKKPEANGHRKVLRRSVGYRVMQVLLSLARRIRKNPRSKLYRDIRVLWQFQEIFCHNTHTDRSRTVIPLHGLVAEAVGAVGPDLCVDCAKTFLHGATKRALCPYDPKPACKHCETPCYQPGYRMQMREVMRFSGSWLIKHGRVHLLLKYLF